PRPLRGTDPRGDPARARRAVHRTDLRAVAGAAVHRPAAARGSRRGAADLWSHTAREPAARDLRAADRARAVRRHWGAGGAARRRGGARDRGVPQPPPDARAVGALAAPAVVSAALSVRGVGKRFG